MNTSSISFLSTFALLMATLAMSNGQLTSASADEGSCVSAPAQTQLAAWTFIFSYTGVWNIPMASEFYYRRYVEVLRGYPAADGADLANMNLEAQSVTAACSLSGYGNSLNQACVPTRYSISNPALITEYTCPAALSSAVNWADWAGYIPILYPIYSPRISVLWTDLTNTLILSECENNLHRMFAVFSKSATLDSSTQATVISELQNAGYNSSYFQYL